MDQIIQDRKDKQKVLTVFLEYPERFLSLRETAMRAGVPQERTKPAISILERHGAVNSTEKKRLRYYQINKHSALYAEMNKVFGSQAKTLEKDFITKSVLGCGKVKFAALTGVFVGEVKSDVDLLVVGKLRLKRLEKCVKALERIVGNEINYTVMAEKEFRERLYTFDWFLKEIREKDPVILVDLITKKGKRRGR
ncbi:MAG: hypothetical protein AAB871_03390 [Patescibacteria group bacterium]